MLPSIYGTNSTSYPVQFGVIEKIQDSSLRSGFVRRLESLGLITPKKESTLGINTGKFEDGVPCDVDKILWKLSEADYFPPEIELTDEQIKVIAWNSFLVTAKVKCKNETDFRTYTTLVPVD